MGHKITFPVSFQTFVLIKKLNGNKWLIKCNPIKIFFINHKSLSFSYFININFLSFRSLIFFETGLHNHINDAKVTYVVKSSILIYNYMKEILPEMVETMHLLLSHDLQEEWRPLNTGDLKSGFILMVSGLAICSIILFIEMIFSFIKKLFARSLSIC